MRCETGEFPIKIIQGDSYRRVYKFYDTDGNVMDNNVISSVILSVSRLNYTQTLNWNAEEEGYVFILSAAQTAEFPYCKGTYDVTLNFRDTQVSTQVYQSSWQIFEKDVFYNTITNNKGYMTCDNSEVVIKTGIMVSAGGAGGTDDHNQLINRNLPNQHPMSAITGLEEALEGKQPSGDYATTQELDELAEIVESKADADDIPTKTSELENDSGFITSIPSEYVTDSELATALQDVRGDIPTKTSDLDNDSGYVNETYVDGEINDLQEQIDAIVSRSDVVDVVGTYAELLVYDTSSLGNNDVVKVLNDSTHNNARSYYRWVIVEGVGSWEYIGSEAISYTKSEEDALLNEKVDKNQGASNVGKILKVDASGELILAEEIGGQAYIAQDEAPEDTTVLWIDTDDEDPTEYYTKTEVDALLDDKQNAISDLASIRSGAALGATAVQPADLTDYALKSDLDDKQNKSLVITIERIGGAGGGSYTADKTNAEIYVAWQSGREVVASLNGGNSKIPCVQADLTSAYFNLLINDEVIESGTIAIVTFGGTQTVAVSMTTLQPTTITDSAGYFTTDTVEGALAEIGAELAGINTLVGSGVIV